MLHGQEWGGDYVRYGRTTVHGANRDPGSGKRLFRLRNFRNSKVSPRAGPTCDLMDSSKFLRSKFLISTFWSGVQLVNLNSPPHRVVVRGPLRLPVSSISRSPHVKERSTRLDSLFPSTSLLSCVDSLLDLRRTGVRPGS